MLDVIGVEPVNGRLKNEPGHLGAGLHEALREVIEFDRNIIVDNSEDLGLAQAVVVISWFAHGIKMSRTNAKATRCCRPIVP